MKSPDPYKLTVSTQLWETMFMLLTYTEKSKSLYMKGRMIGRWENFTSNDLMERYFS